MKLLVVSTLALSLTMPVVTLAGSVENMLGAGIGGAAGAAVGSQIGGQTGAIVGAGVGAAAGAALTNDNGGRQVVRERVYIHEDHHDHGRHRGHHKHD